jgi:hypothetical protein
MGGLWFAFATLATGAVVAWYIKHDKASVKRGKISKKPNDEVS